jgi:hypothetical protein
VRVARHGVGEPPPVASLAHGWQLGDDGGGLLAEVRGIVGCHQSGYPAGPLQLRPDGFHIGPHPCGRWYRHEDVDRVLTQPLHVLAAAGGAKNAFAEAAARHVGGDHARRQPAMMCP